MKIDIPAAAWLRPPFKREPDIVLGVVTRDIYVPHLEGDFQELAVLEAFGDVYRFIGEYPGSALYLRIGEGLTIDDHVRFVPGALDSALPWERCRRLLRRAVWEHCDRFDYKWSKKWFEELKPFAGMRLPDRFTDDHQIDLQLPWLDDLVLIGGLLHRRVEQPLIMVGDFYGGWDLSWGWGDRTEEAFLCYALSEVEAARKAARKFPREEGGKYNASLRKLVRSTQLEATAADYRYALYCEQFCRALKQISGWTINGVMELAKTLSNEDRELLLRAAAVGDMKPSRRADFDFVQTGSELFALDERNPLSFVKIWPRLHALTEILEAEGPPSFPSIPFHSTFDVA
ncbi:MAG: hypothetical protein KL863_28600 [Rhizobium sp.]|nr:hypothetical protein [Rhizobium sp.]